MHASLKCSALGAALCFAAVSFAQAPADAPAGTNGLCNDGTYSQSAVKKGACHGHKGVKEWYASAPAGAAASAPAATPAVAATPAAAAPAAAPMPARKPMASGAGATAPTAAAATGGGPGMVWVNTASNVYHCSGDRWYGKTKQGQYMSEADAKARNARPDHGKACQ